MTEHAAPPAPMAMLAELTHRCPLSCPYCSNPIALERRSAELSTEEWARVFQEAAALGVLQVHLSGGEPAARRDLPALVTAAFEAGLYTNLITSGVGLSEKVFEDLIARGLDHVQLSMQGADAEIVDLIGGYRGGYAVKRQVAEWVRRSGAPLTLNAVVHRRNLHQIDAFIDLAAALGARRLEVAHTQYHGWAYRNRGALMPTLDQVRAAGEAVRAARERLAGVLEIDYVTPDHLTDFPKPCMGGWGRVGINVTPSGKVLPCHAAESIPGLRFETVRTQSLAAIWTESSAFNAFRGVDWMPALCRSCDRRTRDWGGCRCQAFAWTGDAAETDPACSKSPHHARMRAAAEAEAGDADAPLVYRKM